MATSPTTTSDYYYYCHLVIVTAAAVIVVVVVVIVVVVVTVVIYNDNYYSGLWGTPCYCRYPTGAVHHSLIIGTYAACGIITVRRMWSVGVEFGVMPLCPPKILRGLTWE
jgi:hypothetical protein